MSYAWLGAFVLQLSALLFCLVLAMFIVPVVLERVTFYIPRLARLGKEGAVYKRSIAATAFEVVGWSAVVVAVYWFLYVAFPDVFRLVTVSPVAMGAWVVGFCYLTYRYIFFNKVVKREFYRSAYMHYITPKALHAYQTFIEELDGMNDQQLEAQAKLGRAIPYMHRQAVHRKMGERGLLDGTTHLSERRGLLALMTQRPRKSGGAGTQ